MSSSKQNIRTSPSFHLFFFSGNCICRLPAAWVGQVDTITAHSSAQAPHSDASLGVKSQTRK